MFSMQLLQLKAFPTVTYSSFSRSLKPLFPSLSMSLKQVSRTVKNTQAWLVWSWIVVSILIGSTSDRRNELTLSQAEDISVETKKIDELLFS